MGVFHFRFASRPRADAGRTTYYADWLVDKRPSPRGRGFREGCAAFTASAGATPRECGCRGDNPSAGSCVAPTSRGCGFRGSVAKRHSGICSDPARTRVSGRMRGIDRLPPGRPSGRGFRVRLRHRGWGPRRGAGDAHGRIGMKFDARSGLQAWATRPLRGGSSGSTRNADGRRVGALWNDRHDLPRRRPRLA